MRPAFGTGATSGTSVRGERRLDDARSPDLGTIPVASWLKGRPNRETTAPPGRIERICRRRTFLRDSQKIALNRVTAQKVIRQAATVPRTCHEEPIGTSVPLNLFSESEEQSLLICARREGQRLRDAGGESYRAVRRRDILRLIHDNVDREADKLDTRRRHQQYS